MKTKIRYDEVQFNATVKFIVQNYTPFTGQADEVRITIRNAMITCLKEDPLKPYGEMCFILFPEMKYEGIDSDSNHCYFSILVDLSFQEPGFSVEEFSYDI